MFYFTNYYENEYKGRSIKSIKNILSNMNSCLDKYPLETNLSDLDIDDIEKLTQAGEKIGLLCRASLEEHEKEIFDYFDDSYDALSMQDLPVSFSYDEGSVIITTPLTLKKGTTKVNPGHYQLSDYIKAAAIKWKREHPEIDLLGSTSFNGTLIAIITRRAIKYNRHLHCDNDNLEVGRLINTICSLIGIGDNCTKLDILTRFRECTNPENIGTEIIITSIDNLSKYTG